MKEQEKIYAISDEYEAIKVLKREYNKRHPATEYWTMADGNKIKLSDMTDKHILNTINVIERHIQSIEEMGDYDPLEYYD
jgi:hypothetical protein